MEYKYQYETPEERQSLISENQHLELVEDQTITEGNFLIFSDVPRPIRVIVKEVTEEQLLQATAKIEMQEAQIAAQNERLKQMEADGLAFQDYVLSMIGGV